MPQPEQANKINKIQYWEADGFDGHGRPLRAAESVELEGRWDDSRREVLDRDGSTKVIDASVTSLDRDLKIGSILWKGSLVDLGKAVAGHVRAGKTTLPPDNLMEIVTFESVPDVRGREYHREAGLKRLSARMPTAAS